MENKTFIAMKAIIINENNEILIIQESANDPSRSHVGKWDVPGGRLEFGEDPIEGLKREVKEEVGLDVELIKPIDISFWTPKKNNENWYIVAMFMLCEQISKELRISNFEHDAYKWIKLDEINNYNIIPTTLKALNSIKVIK